MERLEVSYRLIADLRPRAGNPRTHSKKQIDQIAASIRRFGFTNPVLLDHEDGIVAGHGRVEAAKRLDMTEVPTLRFSEMSEADVRAYVIADNRLAEHAGWDRQLLGIEFTYLADLDFDFDLTITGFELPEIDALIGIAPADAAAADPADTLPEMSGPIYRRREPRWISAANIGPNLFHQNRTVSWLMSMPRSCSSSSTFRSDNGNRTYIITAKRMISGLVLK